MNYQTNGDGMKNSMQHWNGCQMCSIDTETSGLDSHWHEILQIAILPLDSNLKPRKDVMPFYIEMKPEFPERIDKEAIKINKLDICKIVLRGFDQEKAKDLLREWFDKLGLPYTKSGQFQKRIIPLGQNYAFDRSFIQRWLGIEMYNELFDYHYADTMNTATYLNDRAAMHGEPVPFSKINLSFLANKLDVEIDRAHDALSDTVATAEVYRRLLQQGLLG